MKKIFLALFIVSIGIGASFFYKHYIMHEAKTEKNLNTVEIALHSGDKYVGELISQDENIVRIQPVSVGNLRDTYTFEAAQVKTLNFIGYDDGAIKNNLLYHHIYEEKEHNKHIYQLFKHKKFAELEAIISQYRLNKDRFDTGAWKIDSFYNAISKDDLAFKKDQHAQDRTGAKSKGDLIYDRMEILKQWQAEFPQSITPLILHMVALNDLAWLYRGTGYSRTVDKSGKQHFYELLNKAFILSEQIMAFNQADPYFYAQSVRLHQEIGIDMASWVDKIIVPSIVYDPDYYRIHTIFSYFLLPKWHGQIGSAEAYATNLVQQTANDMLYARIAYKIYTELAYNNKFQEAGFQWERIKKGFEEIITTFPADIRSKNKYAIMACYLEDYDKLKTLMKMPELQWGYLSGRDWYNYGFYAKCLKIANNYVVKKDDLHQFMRQRDFDSFAAAISNGADVNMRNTHGQPALHYAINKGLNRYAQALINAGADLNIAHIGGQAPIHEAVKKGNVQLVKILLENGVEPNLAKKGNVTPLYMAAFNNHTEIANILLQNGALPDIETQDAWTPLKIAAYKGYDGIAQILITHGADVNFTGKNDVWSPLQSAVNKGNTRLALALIAHPNINVNAKGADDWTALHYAAKKGNTPIIYALSGRQDIDVNVTNKYGQTPLFFALENNYTEIVRILKERGAKYDSGGISNDDIKKSLEYNIAGVSYHGKGDYANAEIYYQKSIESNPKNAEAYHNIALLRIAQSKFSECVNYTDRALQIAPNDEKAILSKGQCLFMLRRPPAEFLPYYKRYIELKPGTHRSNELIRQFPQISPDNASQKTK